MEAVYQRLAVSDVPVVNDIIDLTKAYPGKRLRPILVLLCAGMAGGVSRASIETAAIVELLHTATLVHDDVIDRSDLRRGGPTVNSVWDNRAAVLIGDLFFSRVLSWLAQHGNLDVTDIMSKTIRRICEGELIQSQNGHRNPAITEEEYFKTISLKTASLIAASCELGVISSSSKNGTSARSAARQYGEHLGTAFQIKDDLMDYNGRESKMGKPVARDLMDNFLTLPLLYSLRNSTNGDGHLIVQMIQRGITENDIDAICRFVERSGGIAYAQEMAEQHARKALSILDGFGGTEYRASLSKLAGFVIQRDF
jgi:octaprenyl-diphosphate synthase